MSDPGWADTDKSIIIKPVGGGGGGLFTLRNGPKKETMNSLFS